MRKLTTKEKEERIIRKIVKRIKSIENIYGIIMTKRSCFRYYKQRTEESKIKREIKEKEQQLKELKKKEKKSK